MWKVPRVTNSRADAIIESNERQRQRRKEEREAESIRSVYLATLFISSSRHEVDPSYQPLVEEMRRLIWDGHTVNIGKDDYLKWGRSAIQGIAGQFIDDSQDIRATMALREVDRLDREYGFTIG